MEVFSRRDQIEEVINKLFIYTDGQDWDKLQNEVFTTDIFFDMSSLGGEAKNMSAREVCETWRKGFENIDSINHLGGNYIITVNGASADAFAYATATHYKKAATQGTTRDFVGTYQLHLIAIPEGWRIDKFTYNLKFISGNLELK